MMKPNFWQLVEEYQIPYWQLSQICNAPIKMLLHWYDEGAPDDALETLTRHLGIDF